MTVSIPCIFAWERGTCTGSEAVLQWVSAQTKEDFSCRKNRGDASHDLFIFNHFLTRPIALLELAQEVNIDPFLSERVQKCIDESGQTPNFLTVDFYEVGAARDLVNRLNME